MINEKIYINENDDRIWIETYINDDKSVRPAILVIPGGGYISISHFLEGAPIAKAFFERGYNAFVLNYGVGEERDVFRSFPVHPGQRIRHQRRQIPGGVRSGVCRELIRIDLRNHPFRIMIRFRSDRAEQTRPLPA